MVAISHADEWLPDMTPAEARALGQYLISAADLAAGIPPVGINDASAGDPDRSDAYPEGD